MKTFKEAQAEVSRTLGSRDYHSEHDQVAAFLVVADAIYELAKNLAGKILINSRVKILQKTIKTALNELGEPQPGYPANIVNAVEILKGALNGG